MSRSSIENFLSHSAEKVRSATFYGITKIGYRKILCFRGLCHDFCRTFLSQSTENFGRGDFCASLISGTEKIMDKKEGRRKGVSYFSVENFLSHSAKKLRRGTI